MTPGPPTIDSATPAPARTLATASRAELALRRARVGLFQARRLLSWAASPQAWSRPEVASLTGFAHEVYHRAIPLGRCDAGADPVLEAGARLNVRLAALRFDGLVLSPEQPLSFWRVLGRCTAARGFRMGAELRGGCIVPSVGGGLCRLSNAIFRLACELGWTIIERHGHTMEAAPPPGDDPVWGLDATVFWPHVDLRVAPAHGRARLGVEVVRDELRLRVHATTPARVAVELRSVGDVVFDEQGARVRANRIARRVRDPERDLIVREDAVADNRRRLLHAVEQRRNCLTCDQDGCHARVRLPARTS